VLGKAQSALLATSNRCIPVKNKKGCNAVAFCAYKKMQLFSAVFYAVRAENKFESTLFINGREKNHVAIEVHTFDRICMFSCDCHHKCEGTVATLCRLTAFSFIKICSSCLVRDTPGTYHHTTELLFVLLIKKLNQGSK
jgi:hypothetical protein